MVYPASRLAASFRLPASETARRLLLGQDGRVVMSVEEAVGNAHAWFEINSGWAPPDVDTLAEWLADGVCRCPDECLVTPDGWCSHGLASWHLILAALDE